VDTWPANPAGGFPSAPDLLVAARTVQYGALAAAVGGAVFVLAVWAPATARAAPDAASRAAALHFWRRLRTAIAVATGLGLASAALGFSAFAANAAGTGAAAALDRDILEAAAGTRAGAGWVTALGAWLLVAVAVAAARRPGLLVLTLPGLGLAIAGPAMTGHPGLQDTTMVVNLVHVATASAWVGGLVALLAACRAGTWRSTADPGGGLLSVAAARFSTLALCCAGAVLVTGITQTLVLLPAVGDLVDTTYGRLVLVKTACLTGLLAAGAWHRTRALPALHARASAGAGVLQTGAPLRRALRAEVVLAVVVLSVTGFVAGLNPAG
jgi:putative copper export protein